MTCGVYTITNRVTRRVYVGASRAIEARWSQHRCTAKKGTHRSRMLQADWSKHGKEAFVFAVAVSFPSDADKDEINAAEQDLIRRLLDGGTTLYNTTKRQQRKKRPSVSPVARKGPMAMIHELRRARQWTQKDLAERLGVAANTVARWERGDVTPGRFAVRALAQVFGVKMAEIQLPPRSKPPARPPAGE